MELVYGAYLSKDSEQFEQLPIETENGTTKPYIMLDGVEYVYVCDWSPAIDRLADIANGDYVLPKGDTGNKVWQSLKRIQGDIVSLMLSMVSRRYDIERGIDERYAKKLEKFMAAREGEYATLEYAQKIIPNDCEHLKEVYLRHLKENYKAIAKYVKKFTAFASTITIENDNITVRPVLDLLRRKLEELRLFHIQQCKAQAEDEVRYIIENYRKIAKMSDNDEQAMIFEYLERLKKANPNKKFSKSDAYDVYNNQKRLATDYNAGVRYVEREIASAKRYFEGCLRALATRIEEKGLNVQSLNAESAFVDQKLINVWLRDGVKSVHARAIIASGEIQRPHYRFIIT